MSQPGYGRATETLCHDSVALCCVATEKAMRAQQTKLSTHKKAGHARQRYSVVTEISLS